MARPKEQLMKATAGGYQSVAFHDKCEKEKEKLKAKISQQLRDDILRMLDEEVHSDLIVSNGDKTIQAHKSMFLTRVGFMFPELQASKDSSLILKNLGNPDLETLVREVYYVEDVNYLYTYKEYLPHLPKHIEEIARNGDIPAVNLPETILDGGMSGDLTQTQEALNEIQGQNVSLSTSILDSNGNACEFIHDSKPITPIDNDACETSLEKKAEETECDLNNVKNNLQDKSEDEASHDLSQMVKLSYSFGLPHETCSKLGADLLRMFLQEINSDATLVVSEQEFKVHRCVLAARSSYFQAMFGGMWTESGADRILLEGVTTCAIEQALLYLYGGVVDIIEPCELAELLQVADMYGLDGLKDVVSFHIKKDSCHFFHKLCPNCELTAPTALTLAVQYRLEELQERTLKWFAKSFTKIMSTKQFASMPDSVIEICGEEVVDQMTEQTVIDIILECHKLSSKLPHVKWAQPVLDLSVKLMDTAIEFMSRHFVDVVQSNRFLQSGKNAAWSVSVLEDIFSNVIDALPPSKACEAYQALLRLYQYSISFEEDPGSPWGEDMQCLLSTLISYSETYMRHYIHQVMLSPSWRELPSDIRDKILKSASYVCIERDLNSVGHPPQLSNKKISREDQRARMQPRQQNTSAARRSKMDGNLASQSKARQARPSSDGDATKKKMPRGAQISGDRGQRSTEKPTSRFSETGKMSRDMSRSSPSQRLPGPVPQSGNGSRSLRSPPKQMSPRPGSSNGNSSRSLRSPPKQKSSSPGSENLERSQRSPTKPLPGQEEKSRKSPSTVGLKSNGHAARTGSQQKSPKPRPQSAEFSRSNESPLRQMIPRPTGSSRTRPLSADLSRSLISPTKQTSSGYERTRASESPFRSAHGGSHIPLRASPGRTSTLRAALSTGSLVVSDPVQSELRSMSTVNLDSWGLERREYSTTSLDKLVPILEAAFTQPSDADEQEY